MQSDHSTLQDAITSLLKMRGNRVLSIREITRRLETVGLIDVSREAVETAVEQMEAAGRVVAVRGKKYSLVEFTPLIVGRIRIHPDGHGTLRVEADDDVYIGRDALLGAMNGDLVVARPLRGNQRPKIVKGRRHQRGEIVRILQRAHRRVVGRFHDGPASWVRPFDERVDTDIEIEDGMSLGAQNGQMVDVEIIRYPGRNSGAAGRVVEVLGYIWEPGVDVEVVIRQYRLPHEFPEAVVAESDSIPTEIADADRQGRVDLRDRQIVTIDGESARDFDDAVEVERLANGNFRLGVHIADVSHYVREGSEIDREAFERGTSVYFPGRVVPMLPERLSNGICSLNPNVDRLTVSVEIEIDAKGHFVERKIFRSIIRTVERMTYTDVNAILEHPTSELELRYEALLGHFTRMRELFDVLRVRRDSRGSIDFDLPQHEVLLSEGGEIESIRATERNVAHRIIEEFMLAANEVVARELFFANQPGIYRVHVAPDPQKIEDLKEMLSEFGHKLRVDPEEVRPRDLQRVLKQIEGTDEERFLSEIVLRSMTRALYSEDCDGHFALALDQYCHFTSPIRRYPDLIVHRRINRLVSEGPMIGDALERVEAADPVTARQCSERERRAESAERDVMEWKKVVFMSDKMGRRFTGRVTGVVPFGLFVELDEYFVQGLVPVASIGGDYWVYLDREHRLRGQRTSREFRLGDRVSVEVSEVDEDRRQVAFRLIEVEGVATKTREPDAPRDRR